MAFILSSPPTFLPETHNNQKISHRHNSINNPQYNNSLHHNHSFNSFSMRSNSKRKPIFERSTNKISRTRQQILYTDGKNYNRSSKRNIFDNRQSLNKMINHKSGQQKRDGNYRQRIQQQAKFKQFQELSKNNVLNQNQDELFIYRPYNTGHVARKRVIYVNQPENIQINFDYCGCESKIIPCGVLQSAFLNKISMEEMKNQYLRTFQKQPVKNNLNQSNVKVKKFLSYLPKNFPQIFLSQLRNLYPLLAQESPIQIHEFILLSWIQYHSKIEYITYFLFEQLRKSLNSYSPNLYMIELDRELIKQSGNPKIKQFIFSGLLEQNQFIYDPSHKKLSRKQMIGKFENFIDSYLESGGSILIPITYYARFLNVYKKRKGLVAIIGVLAQVLRKDGGREIARVINLWENRDFGRYWGFVRGWDWEQMFDNLLQ